MPRLLSFLCPPAGLLALAIQFAGCAHTQTRPVDPASPTVRSAVNDRARQDGTVLVLTNGEEVASATLRLDAEGASWTDANSGEPRSVPLEAIQAVRVRNRRSFVLRDLGIGLAAGAATGLALGSLGGDPDVVFSRGDLQRLGLGAGAIVGTGVGALIGYEEGRTTFVVSGSTDSVSARPCCGGG